MFYFDFKMHQTTIDMFIEHANYITILITCILTFNFSLNKMECELKLIYVYTKSCNTKQTKDTYIKVL